MADAPLFRGEWPASTRAFGYASLGINTILSLAIFAAFVYSQATSDVPPAFNPFGVSYAAWALLGLGFVVATRYGWTDTLALTLITIVGSIGVVTAIVYAHLNEVSLGVGNPTWFIVIVWVIAIWFVASAIAHTLLAYRAPVLNRRTSGRSGVPFLVASLNLGLATFTALWIFVVAMIEQATRDSACFNTLNFAGVGLATVTWGAAMFWFSYAWYTNLLTNVALFVLELVFAVAGVVYLYDNEYPGCTDVVCNPLLHLIVITVGVGLQIIFGGYLAYISNSLYARRELEKALTTRSGSGDASRVDASTRSGDDGARVPTEVRERSDAFVTSIVASRMRRSARLEAIRPSVEKVALERVLSQAAH
ncbi:MAG TPA: hypothetical protein VLD39_07370, partial [Gammaproteobacteria bacterium]|nr:hypothetical protein [Gammaproteobacteria bacterium]